MQRLQKVLEMSEPIPTIFIKHSKQENGTEVSSIFLKLPISIMTMTVEFECLNREHARVLQDVLSRCTTATITMDSLEVEDDIQTTKHE